MRKEIIGNATLYLGDCRALLPSIGKVAAIITDPPYGLDLGNQLWTYQRGKIERTDWDTSTIEGLDEIRAYGDVQIIWGGNYYQLPQTRGWLSWFKPDAVPSMAHFELAWTNLDKNARQISHSISATNAERIGHPTQKPLAVMRFSIEYAGTPDVVLDPFMGSGSTGVAAIQAGKQFIGVEINPAYFEMARQRIENAQRQERLFA